MLVYEQRDKEASNRGTKAILVCAKNLREGKSHHYYRYIWENNNLVTPMYQKNYQ